MVLSPNYPHNYTAGQMCLYSITVPKEFGKTLFPVRCGISQVSTSADLPVIRYTSQLSHDAEEEGRGGLAGAGSGGAPVSLQLFTPGSLTPNPRICPGLLLVLLRNSLSTVACLDTGACTASPAGQDSSHPGHGRQGHRWAGWTAVSRSPQP